MNAKLLIVDDHDAVRTGLRLVFANTEMDIVEAEGGEAALAVLRKDQ